jgi:hypothetical protein
MCQLYGDKNKNTNALNYNEEDQKIHHSLNVVVLNILLHVSAFQNAIIKDSDMNMLPNVVGR